MTDLVRGVKTKNCYNINVGCDAKTINFSFEVKMMALTNLTMNLLNDLVVHMLLTLGFDLINQSCLIIQ